MVDWANGIETRNYGIKRQTDSRNLLDLLCIILTVLIAAGILMFYSWMHSRLVDFGYEEQKFQAYEESLLRDQQSLILEEQTLKDPERIDAVARSLGMTRLHPNQMISPQPYNVELGNPPTLVLAEAAKASSEPPKPTASN